MIESRLFEIVFCNLKSYEGGGCVQIAYVIAEHRALLVVQAVTTIQRRRQGDNERCVGDGGPRG